MKEKDKFSFIIKEKDRPRPVPVDIGSRGRRTGSPRPFWPPNRTLRHHLTNRPRVSAQNFKANPTVIVDLQDQHFFSTIFSRVRPIFFKVPTSKWGSPSKTRGTRLTLVYATPYNAPYTSLRHAIQPLALRGARGAQGAPGGPRGPQVAPGGPRGALGPPGAPWGPWALWGPGPPRCGDCAKRSLHLSSCLLQT